VCLDSDGIRCIDEDTGVLRCDDGFDDRGQIIDIGQGLYTENNIVVGIFAGGSFFRCSDD
jgi:hypothetical protein